MKFKKTYLIFYQLNPFNIIPIIFLSFFFEITFWKKKYLSNFFLKRFNEILKPGEFSQGEWLSMNSNIFEDFKKNFQYNNLTHKKNRIVFNYKKKEVDLMPSIINHLSYKYEELYNFYNLIKLWEEREKPINFYVIDCQSYIVFRNINFSFKDYRFKRINLLFAISERSWTFLENFSVLLLQFIYILKNVKIINTKNSVRAKIFFYRFSGYDFSIEKNTANFAAVFNNEKQFLKDSLFYFPRKLTQNEKLWAKINHVNCISKEDIFKQLPLLDQLRFISWIFKLMFMYPFDRFRRSMLKYILSDLTLDFFIIEFFLFVKAEILVTWQGAGLSENPIVSILRACGKKTVFCSNSGVGVKHIEGKVPINYFYEQIEEAVNLSEYKFIWSKLDRDLLEKRNLNILFKEKLNTKFEIIGPIMNGNSEWTTKSILDARNKFEFTGNRKCKIWISIFDVPIFFDNDLVNHRWPCNDHPEEMQNLFFDDIYSLLEEYDDLGFIYKPKRPAEINNKGNRIIVESLRKFISTNNKFVLNDRVIILQHNVDPYIPIAISDFAICMPFTSAAQAMIYFNKQSIYYDPTGYNKNVLPKEISDITILNKSELRKCIKQWQTIKEYDHDKYIYSLKNIIYNNGDPRKNLLKKINNLLSN